MFCSRCGTQLPDNAKFCYSCGAQLGGGSSAPGAPAGYPGAAPGMGAPPPPPAAPTTPTAPKDLKCPSCGAPLSPEMGDAVLTCQYCGATVSIAGTGWKPVTQHSMLMAQLLDQDAALKIVKASMDAGWFHGHRFEDSQVTEAKFVFAPYWIVPSAATTRYTYQEGAVPMGGGMGGTIGTMAASAFIGNALSRGRGEVFVPMGGGGNMTRQDQMSGNYQFPVVAVKGYTQYQPKSYQFNLQARQPYKKENVPGGATVLNGDVGETDAQQAARVYVAEMQAEAARKKHGNVSGVQSNVEVGEPELLHAPVWYFTLNHKGSPAVLLVDANASRVMLQNI